MKRQKAVNRINATAILNKGEWQQFVKALQMELHPNFLFTARNAAIVVATSRNYSDIERVVTDWGFDLTIEYPSCYIFMFGFDG